MITGVQYHISFHALLLYPSASPSNFRIGFGSPDLIFSNSYWNDPLFSQIIDFELNYTGTGSAGWQFIEGDFPYLGNTLSNNIYIGNFVLPEYPDGTIFIDDISITPTVPIPISLLAVTPVTFELCANNQNGATLSFSPNPCYPISWTPIEGLDFNTDNTALIATPDISTTYTISSSDPCYSPVDVVATVHPSTTSTIEVVNTIIGECLGTVTVNTTYDGPITDLIYTWSYNEATQVE